MKWLNISLIPLFDIHVSKVFPWLIRMIHISWCYWKNVVIHGSNICLLVNNSWWIGKWFTTDLPLILFRRMSQCRPITFCLGSILNHQWCSTISWRLPSSSGSIVNYYFTWFPSQLSISKDKMCLIVRWKTWLHF